MDQLIGAALEALAAAAEKKRAPDQQAAQAADPRYAEIMQRLQERVAARAQPSAPPQGPPTTPAATVQNVGGSAIPSGPERTSNAPDMHGIVPARRAMTAARGVASSLFEDGNSVLRAVIAAEVLSPPLAFRENAHWQILRPKESST